MKPLTLRTKLTLFYSITVSVLLTGFGLVYYRVLSVGLDRDITQDVIDRASGLRGYLRFEEGVPIFDYDPNDPDELSFINTATRYYQLYELHGRESVAACGRAEQGGRRYCRHEPQPAAARPWNQRRARSTRGRIQRHARATGKSGGRDAAVYRKHLSRTADTSCRAAWR